jgi:hypothetical protein
MRRSSRTRAFGVSLGVPIAALALLIPSIALAATVKVPAIPGGGWVQTPEKTVNAVIATSPTAGLGASSLKLVTNGMADKSGVAREVLGPLSGLTGASWMTYATGTSSILISEPATLKFSMYRLGGTNEFTTMVVERTYNATVTAGTWQKTTLEGNTVVWQTTGPGFCDQLTFCTFAEFKEQYPNATLLGLQVAIGSGIPATTSYVDGVSITTGNEVTDTWNFELAVKPTPRPTKTPTVTTPPTDATPMDNPPSFDGGVFIILGATALTALVLIRPLPSRRRR